VCEIFEGEVIRLVERPERRTLGECPVAQLREIVVARQVIVQVGGRPSSKLVGVGLR